MNILKTVVVILLSVRLESGYGFLYGSYHGSERRLVVRSESREDMLARAEQLRKEVEAEEALLSRVNRPKPQEENLRIVLPMSKPDWSVVDEEVEFKKVLEGQSELIQVTVPVPCGLILEEFDNQTIAVAAVGQGSNAEKAGIQPGWRLRATSAIRAQMEMPTWQLLAGGIGRPKLFRFIFGTDLQGPPPRSFEDVLSAVASNRDDPNNTPALLVFERPL